MTQRALQRAEDDGMSGGQSAKRTNVVAAKRALEKGKGNDTSKQAATHPRPSRSRSRSDIHAGITPRVWTQRQ